MSQFRKLLVGKAVNYGASKTSATAQTALTPDQLADGAIAFYGIHMATSGFANQFKMVQLMDGGAEAAGKVPVASFVGKEVYLCQGTSYGNLISPPISKTPQGIQDVRAKVYTAPVKGTTAIGYSPNITALDGLLNFPATVLRGDNVSFGVTNRRYKVAGEREPMAKERYSVELAAGDTAYIALTKLVNAVMAVDVLQRMIDYPKITGNYAGAVFTTSATSAVTNGSTAVTTSAAHGVTVGQFVAFNGDVYKATVIGSATTMTLDRVYQGPTNAALPNAQSINTGSTTAPTQLGLEITDLLNFSDIDITVSGIINGATLRKTVLPQTGSGSIAHMQAMEKEFKVMKGTSDFITQYIIKDLDYTDTTLTGYDLYWITVQNPNHSGGDMGSVFKVQNILVVAFPQGVADTTGFNQASFENVLTALFAACPQIS